jgi:RNase P/RNase MRP subunit POP5
MKPPISVRAKKRYTLFYSEEPIFEGIERAFKILYGELGWAKARVKVVYSKPPIWVIRVNKKYLTKFLISYLYFKKTEGANSWLLSISGTIKSAFKKAKVKRTKILK